MGSTVIAFARLHDFARACDSRLFAGCLVSEASRHCCRHFSHAKTSMSNLFEPTRVGAIALANRIVMAPLTRNRAGARQVPSDLAVTYYSQRASAGLVVTEASQISPQGQGYLDTPGIYSPE